MDNNLPKRKSPRLADYDYSSPGAYFVTICTHKHKCILSKINVGAIHESPENRLTPYGQFADDVINTLENRFNVNIDKYVVMPNHIHMLIVIEDDERAIRESPLQYHRSVIDKMVGYLKMNVSKKIHLICNDLKVWQRSYHDHIIRGKEDYLGIWEYIDTNAIRWDKDCFYVDEGE